MNSKLQLVALLALVAISSGGVEGVPSHLFPDDTNCNDGFIGNKGQDICYKVLPDAGLDYWEASEKCVELGGSLMSVDNRQDLLTRLRSAKTLFSNRELRIMGYQVSKDVFKDNEGNVIKVPTLGRQVSHSATLTVSTNKRKNGIVVKAKKVLTDKLGIVCQRERQGEGKKVKPIKVKPSKKDDEEEEDKDVKSGKFFECGSRIWVSKKGVHLLSHEGADKKEDYPSNYFCSWLLAVPEGKSIRLSFKRFDLEGSGSPGSTCLYDYVNAYDGRSESSGSLYEDSQCGDKRPESVVSTGRYMNVTFVSDNTVEYSGFIADIKQIDDANQKQSCRDRCEVYDSSYSCQCDDKCDKFHDCCFDFQRVCY